MERLARSSAVLLIGLLVAQIALAVAGAGALYVAWRFFPERFAAAEQVVLSRWLRPEYLGDGRPRRA